MHEAKTAAADPCRIERDIRAKGVDEASALRSKDYPVHTKGYVNTGHVYYIYHINTKNKKINQKINK